MDTQPSDEPSAGVILRTPDELFARPECTHIVTLNNPGQNLHLERTPAGFQCTAGSSASASLGTQHHHSRAFPSLEAVYEDWDRVYERVEKWNRVSVRRAVRRFRLREAIWQDISASPAFPYSVLWHSFENPVELHIPPDSEHMTAHGPHVIFGPVEIATPTPHTFRLTPASGWLIVEHPAYTLRGQISRAILRPTHGILDRLRHYLENRRLRRDKSVHIVIRPGVTVVYGLPPADWQSVRLVCGLPLLPATPLVSPASSSSPE